MKLAVLLVVFERDLAAVPAWPRLMESKAAQMGAGVGWESLIVYDNSPTPRATLARDVPGCLYVHDASNGGTAAACSVAAKLACESGVDWLLMLDHDTALPVNFFQQLARAEAEAASFPVAAFVPWVTDRGNVLSPAEVSATGSIRPLSRTPAGGLPPLTAIASGCVLRVSVLASLMPLPTGLWLDYVDHWIFAKIRAQHGDVRIVDTTLEHDLSIAHPESLSKRRLFSVLDGEARFVASLGWQARWAHPFRLARRLARYLLVRPRLATWMAGWLVSRRRVAP